MKNLFAVLLILGISSNAYAYFCSSQKGHGYINIGDSMQTVRGACGVPDTVTNKTTGGSKMITVQHWTYTHKPIQTRFDSPLPKSNTTYPPDVTFQVIDGKVTSIASAGKAHKSSNLCRTGMQISVGQSAQSVIKSCGRPDFVESRQQIDRQPEKQITVWTYKVPSGSPIVLEFINGQLTKIN